MRHRLFKAGAAILAFIATLPAAVTPAYAHASTHNAVIFGDSVVANPELIRYVATWLKIPTTTPPTERGECPTSPHNFGVLAAQRLGLRADNYACAGAVGVGDKSLLSASRRSVSLQIDQAAAQRTLNRNTKRVFISLGFNDTYSQLARGRTDHQIRHDFAAKMTREVARIRKLAPMPAFSSSDILKSPRTTPSAYSMWETIFMITLSPPRLPILKGSLKRWSKTQRQLPEPSL